MSYQDFYPFIDTIYSIMKIIKVYKYKNKDKKFLKKVNKSRYYIKKFIHILAYIEYKYDYRKNIRI